MILPRMPIAMAAAAVVCFGLVGQASAAPSHQGRQHRSARVCATPAPGFAACNALVVLDAAGKPDATSGPSGLNPADIRSAYALTGSSSAGRTVAIVDAYHDPTAEADLGVYRAAFGLPACTTANACFRQVNQTGGSKYPRTNAGWATEISLGLDMVSAACPDCRILLVEGASGWQVYRGTSASAPVVASVYAISGNTAGYPASYTWSHASSLNDVTTGSNGTCSTTIWCNATSGWDGPTGLGTRNGTGAF
jgi:hypothetical protein